MVDVAPGQVFTADKIETHAGKLGATPNYKLVLLFLGTCPGNTVPRVMPILRQLGWSRSDMYEVALDIVRDGARESRRTLFQCEDPFDALEAAARFAHRQATIENEKLPGWALDAVLVNVVRFGDIDEDGNAQNVRGDIVLEWKQSSGVPLLDAIDKLRPNGPTDAD